VGGQEGSRGYLYQAITAVLNSLNENGWEYVQIEPDSVNDKIDVLWEYEDKKKKAIQVKSSVNNMSKADIEKWLEELIIDAGEAEEISLLLIGSCSDNTKRFINKLGKRKSDEAQQEDGETIEIASLDSYNGQINVQLENFDHEALEAKVNKALERFLTRKGKSTNYFQREMMTGSIIYQFLVFSMSGKKVSKKQFEETILEWIHFIFPEIVGSSYTRYLPFKVAEYDYKKMLELNSIIEALKEMDNKIVVKNNRIHNGWAVFEDMLTEIYEHPPGPFIDGLHQQLYRKFFNDLYDYTALLAYGANPNPMGWKDKEIKIKMWGQDIYLMIDGISDITFPDIKEKAETCLGSWEVLKTEISNRYIRDQAKIPYL